MTVRFDTKIAIAVRADLEPWQKLNVTAFLASGIAASSGELIGKPYEDGSGNTYLELFRQPVVVYAADAETLSLAAERYAAVLALRHEYLQTRPEAGVIFDFLERHWPKLANSIGSHCIPATNNAVELVIRRFDQHYQNFCGFESIADAQRYLAVFEKIYRFTPFSQDAQPRIRGKSPLQLAGYHVASLPMTTLCAGLSIMWPTQTGEADDVPNQLR